MPELPEVEVVRRGLLPHAIGARIADVTVRDARSVRHQVGGPAAFIEGLRDHQITGIARRGKFLWWRMAEPDGTPSGLALVTHLGMSGQLRVDAHDPVQRAAVGTVLSEGPAPDPHRHLRISLQVVRADATRSSIGFLDQRLFGGMWLSALDGDPSAPPSGEGSPDGLLPTAATHIARDLLDPHLDRDRVVDVLGRRSAPIKSLLLDQSLMSGIGNIYADEGLWVARVRFDTPASAVSVRKRRLLLSETAEVMQRALAVGGTSFDALYVNVDGRSGYFARSLHAYGREGEPCDRCGTPLRRVMHGGRSSHFCARCQRRR